MGSVEQQQRAVFDSLLRPHLDRLFRFAFRLTASRAEAEDLFQDVLLKVYTRIDELVDIQDPAPWLCRVMYNHFIDDRRRFARARLVNVTEGQIEGPGIEAFAGNLDPERDAERLDNIMRLDRALRTLSEDHRLVILLHDSEGYKLEEIHRITGDPLGTIKSRLHRARARLREILQEDGTNDAPRTCRETGRK